MNKWLAIQKERTSHRQSIVMDLMWMTLKLTEQRDPPIGTDVQPITGQVTIRRKSTGAEKIYAAGHGSSWPAEFEQDLRQGFFN